MVGFFDLYGMSLPSRECGLKSKYGVQVVSMTEGHSLRGSVD